MEAVKGGVVVAVSGALLAALIACNSGAADPTRPTPPGAAVPPPAPPPSTTDPPPPATTLSATIVITPNNSFQPSEVKILVGGRVTFINQNNRAHDITSDPPHLHTDCPPVMEVGFIQPGQTKVSGTLTTVRTCGFHDHMQENNPDLRGKIIIEGPG
jgi:plastocyanin